MSTIRRMGVIADHGSLEAYRDFVIEGQDECRRRLLHARTGATRDLDHARIADLTRELADWQCDLDWVYEEIAIDAVAA